MSERNEREATSAEAEEHDKHDSGIRIRGEAPATGRLEQGGMTPGSPPAELDSPPPGSLQGSPLGISEAIGGHVPADEVDAWTEGDAGWPEDPRSKDGRDKVGAGAKTQRPSTNEKSQEGDAE